MMRSRLSREEKRFLERARVCRVASVDPRGVTHAAPLCHAFDAAIRTAYVATSGVTAANLKRRRRAAIESDDYFEDWVSFAAWWRTRAHGSFGAARSSRTLGGC